MARERVPAALRSGQYRRRDCVELTGRTLFKRKVNLVKDGPITYSLSSLTVFILCSSFTHVEEYASSTAANGLTRRLKIYNVGQRGKPRCVINLGRD